jgi:hypothetical protein
MVTEMKYASCWLSQQYATRKGTALGEQGIKNIYYIRRDKKYEIFHQPLIIN